MQLINRTPHQLTLRNAEGEIITIAAPERTFRVTQSTVAGGSLGGIPVHVSKFGEAVEVDNDDNKAGTNASQLPEPAEGVFYVVSGLVASALPHRTDLLTPFIVERDKGVPTAWQLGTTHADWQATDWYDGASQPVAPQQGGAVAKEWQPFTSWASF